MGKLVFYGAISLDGYLAGAKDQLDWLLETDTGTSTTYEKFFETIDATAMGRKTYEEAKKMLATEKLYPEKENYVFSRQMQTDLTDAVVVDQDPVAFLSQLKKEKTVWLVGGGNLLHLILEADLIDEWYVQIAPVLLGTGKRLFEPGEYAARLQFVDMTQMGELIEIHYQRK
ncbi:dihydrofolate reductase family protein [Enterococcus gallinarum]|uniref:dihydrofolate reductase family protein n=1 Tax=Enterococcus gallinarum TaxID=1353 RepID=UPI001D1768EE|nr:dihydrofolate reductase family protein [Enterococcus gallinarum]MCC4046279.1 dihydrofolate reductase family protein [Enterococcus gallinarum]